MEPVVVEREVVIAAPREVVWALISDTDRMNRLAGVPPVEYVPIGEDEQDGGAARYLARQQFFGLELVYEERPYEWSWGERFSVQRPMRRGPLHRQEMEYLLSDGPDGGTVARLRLRLEPRSGLLRPIASVAGRQALANFAKALEVVEKRASTGRWPSLRQRVDDGALRRARDELVAGGVDAELTDRLIDHVAGASDADVSRLRPYELADRWELPRRTLLAGCLAAVGAGLLELRWELVCPSCRTAAAQVESLADLAQGEGHCQLCDITFGLELDRSVEATFAPTAAVRKVDQLTYCIGGPARTPHVLAQAVLRPGDAHTFAAPAEPGRYRLFLRGGATAALAVEGDGPEVAEVAIDEESFSPATIRIGPAGALRLRYDGRDERHAKLEHLSWASRAATAHAVSTFPEFRGQFSEQVLHPGVCLKVGRVAILFSDLTGSTQLYTDVGDAAAFKLVQQHFDLLRARIEAEEGVIVKTIGDAIMAAFEDEGRAVRAAVAMLAAFPGFARQAGHPDVTLKLGVHAGACYAVTANEQLDYFGQTVNVAARLQGQADGGELVLLDELAARAAAEGWLGPADVRQRFEVTLKGVAGQVQAARVAL